MPCAGEEPITSFFHRVPKRRSLSDVRERKRRRNDDSTEAISSSAKHKKQQKQSRRGSANLARSPTDGVPAPCLPQARTLTTPPQTSCNISIAISPGPCVNNYPTPQSNGRPIQEKISLSLPTPPPTRPSTRKIEKLAHLPDLKGWDNGFLTPVSSTRSQILRPKASMDYEYYDSSLLDPHSPSLAPRSERSQRTPHSDNPIALQHQLQAENNRPPTPTHLLSMVPSSQSQDRGIENDFSEQAAARKAPCFLTHKTLVDNAATRSRSNSEASSVGITDEQHYVQSSQSQYLLPVCASPNRDSRGRCSRFSTPSSVVAASPPAKEVIPSSQSSSEGELDVSKPFSYSNRSKDLAEDSLSATQAPARRHFGWRTTPQKYPGVIHPPAQDGEESLRVPVPSDTDPVTEESDDEHDVSFCASNTTWSPPSLYDNYRESSILSDLASTQSTTSTDYPSSLPDVVKEFRDMFGSDSEHGSYLDDFPMTSQ